MLGSEAPKWSGRCGGRAAVRVIGGVAHKWPRQLHNKSRASRERERTQHGLGESAAARAAPARTLGRSLNSTKVTLKVDLQLGRPAGAPLLPPRRDHRLASPSAGQLRAHCFPGPARLGSRVQLGRRGRRFRLCNINQVAK